MAANDSNLTQDRLKELFSYNENTGIFTNLTQRGRNVKVGASAGSVQEHGYIRVMVDRKRYLAHRLAWLYVYGELPSQHLDHMNGEPSDNRIANLRLVTVTENCQNRRVAAVNSKSGILGISQRDGGKWRAAITVNGVKLRLGTFSTPEEASEVYLASKRALHSACTI